MTCQSDAGTPADSLSNTRPSLASTTAYGVSPELWPSRRTSKSTDPRGAIVPAACDEVLGLPGALQAPATSTNASVATVPKRFMARLLAAGRSANRRARSTPVHRPGAIGSPVVRDPQRMEVAMRVAV